MKRVSAHAKQQRSRSLAFAKNMFIQTTSGNDRLRLGMVYRWSALRYDCALVSGTIKTARKYDFPLKIRKCLPEHDIASPLQMLTAPRESLAFVHGSLDRVDEYNAKSRLVSICLPLSEC
jgi:hypothetical protein